MKMVLQPGIRAPGFTWPDANQELGTGGKLAPGSPAAWGQPAVLLFFPSAWSEELAGQLAQFQQRLGDLQAEPARLIGISDATPDALKALAVEKQITFPLSSDSNPPQAIASRYHVVADDGTVLSAVFVIDAGGLIRRVYDSSTDLPNPAMVVRAVKKLKDAPMPPEVTQADWRSGGCGAPVVLIEYADYQCRHCQDLAKLLKQILPSYGDRVSLVFRHFPLRHSHPLAMLAAEAAEAAGAQGRFWEMHAQLFAAANALEREQLIAYARTLDLDMARFIDDLDSHRYEPAVNQDFREATGNRIKFPPALFVNRIALDPPHTAEAIRARVDQLLACTDLKTC